MRPIFGGLGAPLVKALMTCCAKHLAGTVAKYCTSVKSYDLNGTEKN